MNSIKTKMILGALSFAFLGTSASAQQVGDDQVSRAEHESLRQQVVDLQAKLDGQPAHAGTNAQPLSGVLDETSLRLSSLESFVSDLASGDSAFHLAGFAFAGFTDSDGSDSTFSAGFVPIFLWQINDRLLFEAEVEFDLGTEGGEGTTKVDLGYANGSYILNDYIIVGAGKFLTPFGVFGNRLHPVWINKLPNAPLGRGHGGIAPPSSVGAYVRGAVPLGKMKMTYDAYISNGPSLETGGHGAGALNFENFEDFNQSKTIGGRIGFFPLPYLELGYSFQYGDVSASDFPEDVSALLQGVDLSYVKTHDQIGGIIDFRAEWVFSDVDDATFFDEADGEYFTFDNKRNGGYVQAAYRPTLAGGEVLKNFELVTRYDRLDFSSVLQGADKSRWSIGLNYWFSSSSVLKVSYQQTDIDGEDNTNAFLAQIAFGF